MRAQSETVGFVLIFALIVSTVGLVYGTGTAGLQSAQQAEQIQNVERAFGVLDENLGALQDGAPSRSTEISLTGGTLRYGDQVQVRIDAVDTTNASHNTSFTTRVSPIVFEKDDTTVAYSNGAIIRSDRGQATLIEKPQWVVDSDRAIIPYLTTYSTNGTTSVGGRGTMLILANRHSRGLAGQFDAGSADVRVNVTIVSPRAAAWAEFFEEEGYTAIDTDASDGDVTYQFVTDVLYVHRTGIEIQLQS